MFCNLIITIFEFQNERAIFVIDLPIFPEETREAPQQGIKPFKNRYFFILQFKNIKYILICNFKKTYQSSYLVRSTLQRGQNKVYIDLITYVLQIKNFNILDFAMSKRLISHHIWSNQSGGKHYYEGKHYCNFYNYYI